jgi:hypothetical protein
MVVGKPTGPIGNFLPEGPRFFAVAHEPVLERDSVNATGAGSTRESGGDLGDHVGSDVDMEHR